MYVLIEIDCFKKFDHEFIRREDTTNYAIFRQRRNANQIRARALSIQGGILKFCEELVLTCVARAGRAEASPKREENTAMGVLNYAHGKFRNNRVLLFVGRTRRMTQYTAKGGMRTRFAHELCTNKARL